MLCVHHATRHLNGRMRELIRLLPRARQRAGYTFSRVRSLKYHHHLLPFSCPSPRDTRIKRPSFQIVGHFKKRRALYRLLVESGPRGPGVGLLGTISAQIPRVKQPSHRQRHCLIVDWRKTASSNEQCHAGQRTRAPLFRLLYTEPQGLCSLLSKRFLSFNSVNFTS